METGLFFGACKETARRRWKENGNSKKKTDQELEQDKNSKGSTVKKLIPRASGTHPYPSPTPEQGPHGRSSPLSLTHATTPSPHPRPRPRQPVVSSPQSTSSTMTGGSRTEVKRTKDAALEHVRKALRTNGSLLTRPEVGFIRTSCHILGINSEATMRVIMKRAKDKGGHQPRKVLDSLQSQLVELANRVEKHKRPTRLPLSTRGHLIAWGRRRAVWRISKAV
jgi:hypothetical protein